MKSATDPVHFHHVAFAVSDLRRTVDFYTNVIGLELRSVTRYEFAGYGQSLFGSSWRDDERGCAAIDIALFELRGVRLEFDQYINPPGAAFDGYPAVIGSGHLALKVKNIDVARKRLEQYGIEFTSPINRFDQDTLLHPWDWCYLRDPDGILIELVQELPAIRELEAMGERLRELRLDKGLTLKDVAESIDISTAHLSQIERGEAAPSVTALLNITASLGVSPDFVFRRQARDESWMVSAVIPQEETGLSERAESQSSGDGHPLVDQLGSPVSSTGLVQRRWLTGRQAAIQLEEVHLGVGAAVEVEGFRQRGNVSAVISEGTLLVEVGESSYVLKAGSAFSCDRLAKQRYVNIGDVPVVGTWAVTAE